MRLHHVARGGDTHVLMPEHRQRSGGAWTLGAYHGKGAVIVRAGRRRFHEAGEDDEYSTRAEAQCTAAAVRDVGPHLPDGCTVHGWTDSDATKS